MSIRPQWGCLKEQTAVYLWLTNRLSRHKSMKDLTGNSQSRYFWLLGVQRGLSRLHGKVEAFIFLVRIVSISPSLPFFSQLCQVSVRQQGNNQFSHWWWSYKNNSRIYFIMTTTLSLTSQWTISRHYVHRQRVANNTLVEFTFSLNYR